MGSDQPDYSAAEAVARELLAQLPDDLLYHGTHHTLDDVLPNVEMLLEVEPLPEAEARLLRIAALYHDVGFLQRYDANEPLGAAKAVEVLGGLGFSAEQLDAVRRMVLATTMPQHPQTHLEQMLCDADLGNLGTELFFLRTEQLRLERIWRGYPLSARRWYEMNVTLLQVPYHTPGGRQLWGAAREANLAAVQELLGS